MSTYEDILKKAWGEVPKVKLLPVGSWELEGKNASWQEPKKETGNPYFMLVYVPVRALDDVNAEALAELGEGYEVKNNRIFHRVWIETSADLDAFRKHLTKHGLNVTDEQSIEETLAAFKGSRVIVYLDQREFANNAGELVKENVAKAFAPVG